jgi:hypothetical protein
MHNLSECLVAVKIWDEELGQLAERAQLVFGEAAVLDAMVRAAQSTPSMVSDQGDDLALVPADGVTHLDVVKVADAIRILKAELRRLLTAH